MVWCADASALVPMENKPCIEAALWLCLPGGGGVPFVDVNECR
jgi:hypothetical protein